MTKKIFIIAGESSGDALGAGLLTALLKRIPDLEVRGIGGERMKAAGLSESFFPMDELSVMGLAEVLPRVPKFIGLIRKTVEAIKGYNPDLVVTIDSPDFCFRVQKGLKKSGVAAKRVHYVAPTVWAWRPGRARYIAQFLDGIMCLFPFEVPYFEREGLSAVAVGHPMVESGVLDGDGTKFRALMGIPDDAKVFGAFCGSRSRELEMSIPIMKDIITGLRSSYPELYCVVPTLPKREERLKTEFSGFDRVVVTSDHASKYDAFHACDVAAAVSGTVALEVALAGVPHALFYKMNKVTWEIVRRMVRTQFAHLGNILLDRRQFPEFLQEDARADDMVLTLKSFLCDADAKTKARGYARELVGRLSTGPKSNSSEQAAHFLLAQIGVAP